MLGRIRKAAVLAAMLGVGFGMGSAQAGEIDLSGKGTGSGVSDTITNGGAATISSGTYVWNNGAENATYSEAGAIKIESTRTLLFGTNTSVGVAAGSPFQYTLTSGSSTGQTGKLDIKSGRLEFVGDSGSTVSVVELGSQASTNNIILNSSTSASKGNNLNVESITDNSLGNLTIGENSSFNVTGTGGSTLGNANVTASKFNIKLDGGLANFRGGVNLQNGEITGSGTIRGDTELGTNLASITVEGDETQIYTNNLVSRSGTINVTSTGSDPAKMYVNGALTLAGTSAAKSSVTVGQSGTFTVGTDSAASKTDSLSNADLTVSGTGQANFYNIVELNGNAEITAEKNGTDSGTVTFYNEVKTNGSGNALKADGSTLVFKKELDLQGGDTLVLDNGGVGDYSAVNGGLVLGASSGQIISRGSSNTTDANKFIAASLTGGREDAVSIEGGSSLQLLSSDSATPVYASYIADSNKSIQFDNAGEGTFEVGNMIITENVQTDIYNAVSPTSGNNEMVINGQLTVNSGAIAKGSQFVDTTVEKNANIFGSYIMADSNNTFNGDILVSGSNAVLGTDGAAGMTQKEGKTLAVKNGATLGSGGTLNINEGATDPATEILFNGSGTNTVKGIVNAEKANTAVNSNLILDGTLNTNKYVQTYGDVTSGSDPDSNKLIVRDTAVITGSQSTFSTNGDFYKSLDVLNGARLVGNDNTLTGMPLADGSSPILNVDSSSSIDLSNRGMTINGFSDINANGTILIGYGNGQPNALELDSNTTLHTDVNKSIQFTNDFVKAYYDRGNAGSGEQFIQGGQINDDNPGTWGKSTLYGDFTFTYNDPNKQGAYVSSFEKRDVNNTSVVSDYLSNTYFGDNYMTDSIAGNASGIATGSIISNGTMGGGLNQSIFEAIGANNSTFTYMGRQGSMTRDLFAVMSGTPSAAPVYIAQDSVRHVMGTLDTRLDAFRKVRECVVNECFSSETALGSAQILNDRYLNRIWAGALGNWQSASERKGYEGYKYKPAGGILGYDRAFGAAVVGMSFAFMEGNYTDKTFEWNDSKIRQYDANLYATYNFSSGFFTTFKAGYEYQRNKLNYGSGSNKFNEKSHTQTMYASGKLGYDIMPCDNFSITPSLGVNYFYTRTGGHNVDWNDIEFMRYDRMKNHQVELPVEVEVSYEIPFSAKSGLTLTANGGYSYNFTDRGVRGDVSNIGLVGISRPTAISESTGRKQGHHAWMAGAGAKFRYDNWEVGVKYDYYGRNSANTHQISGVVGYSF